MLGLRRGAAILLQRCVTGVAGPALQHGKPRIRARRSVGGGSGGRHREPGNHLFAFYCRDLTRRASRGGILLALAVILEACVSLQPASHYVGNTLYVLRENGKGSHYIYFYRDRTCEVVSATTQYSCTYVVKDSKLCLTATRLGGGDATTRCHPFESHRRAGEEWDGIDGGRVHYRLAAGQGGHLEDNKP